MSGSAAPPPGNAPAGTDEVYSERLLPTPLMWLLAPAVGLALWFIFSAVHNVAGTVVALLGAFGVAAALWAGSPVVRVRAAPEGVRWLHAGRARIEADHLGPARSLDVVQMQQAMGPQLRSDAYVCQRPWVHTGVRVPVIDPTDPTPYWLVATRFPERLVAALGQQHAN
ncbi:DUF3093 domain-containing protein [Pseudactinotalea sp. Z1739]|uniref:DUF3093 domain-containing protein n=1 Tax=Pseudactinotalea sp. Z1739 TaxID=3413028 RepID=UPI003C7D8FC2